MKLLAGALFPHPPIVIPEIGGQEGELINDTYQAMEELARRIDALEPDTLVIISPHGNLFRDALCVIDAPGLSGNLSEFGAPDLSFDYELDRELVENLRKKTRDFPLLFLDKRASRDLGSLSLDHGATVPLYFLDRKLRKKPRLVHINYGLLSPEMLGYFGGLLRSSIEEGESKTVIIASGDLSHRLKLEGPYDYHESGPIFDSQVRKIIEGGNLEDFFSMEEELVENAGECALRSLQVLAGALRGLPLKTEVLSYQGPWGVGYMCAYMEAEEEKDEIILLATRALEELILRGRELEFEDSFSSLLTRRAGCFVSLHKFGELRGCIGTLEPTRENLALEIIKNTRSAALDDPRFPRVEEDELKELVLGVDVLGPVEACSYEELDPKIYGVIVRSGAHQGLLLPDLPGVKTRARQVEIARNKAGIGPHEPLSYFRFKVSRHGN